MQSFREANSAHAQNHPDVIAPARLGDAVSQGLPTSTSARWDAGSPFFAGDDGGISCGTLPKIGPQGVIPHKNP
jgi:hypothetical protein